MKLVMDERLKHRLVGFLVVLSIVAIFVPAIIKKSNHRFEGDRLHVVSIRLPEKPALPMVVVPTEETVFKRVKVAHVDIDTAIQPVESLATISKAERLSTPTDLSRPVLASQISPVQDLAAVQKHESKLLAVQLKKTDKPLLNAKNIKPASKPILAKVATNNHNNTKARPNLIRKKAYAIQLGTFSDRSNALSLLNKLKKIGFNAHFIEISNKNSKIYKVLVGNVSQKEAALTLQRELLAATQIKGFIVPSTQIG